MPPDQDGFLASGSDTSKLDLLLTPQAFSLSACPAARVFLAALMSRSCSLPHAAPGPDSDREIFFPSGDRTQSTFGRLVSSGKSP